MQATKDNISIMRYSVEEKDSIAWIWKVKFRIIWMNVLNYTDQFFFFAILSLAPAFESQLIKGIHTRALLAS